MKADFWHEKWQANDIAFHEPVVNPILVAHLPRLNLQPGSRIFLPLCGKTRDFGWLMKQGYQVAGAELSELAITQLFDELEVVPKVTRRDKLTQYSAPDIDIFVGDILDLTPEQLGHVDATYDRAALVALPAEMRKRYASHLSGLTGNAPQLLVTFEYDQGKMSGPPFAVPEAAVKEYYSAVYRLEGAGSTAVVGGLKGQVEAMENVWILHPRGM